MIKGLWAIGIDRRSIDYWCAGGKTFLIGGGNYSWRENREWKELQTLNGNYEFGIKSYELGGGTGGQEVRVGYCR